MPIARPLPIAFAVLMSALACAPAAAETFIVFDAPAAVAGGTPTPAAINASGTLVGTITSRDSQGNFVYTAFLRTPDGALTLLHPNPNQAPPLFVGSFAKGINDAGIVVGADNASAFKYDSTNGSATIYDQPGAIYGTIFYGINANGDVAGGYSDGRTRSFIIKADGSQTLLPDDYWTTYLRGINAQGDAAGYLQYGAVHSRKYGLLVSHDGTSTPFDVALSHPDVVGINDSGTIVGYAEGSLLRCNSGPVLLVCGRGFLRKADGTLSTFQVLASDGTPDNTFTAGINNAGTVVGYHMKPDYQAPVEGFVRDAAGNVTSFAVPGMQYTYATAINDNGVVAGYAQDANYVAHGFVRLP